MRNYRYNNTYLRQLHCFYLQHARTCHYFFISSCQNVALSNFLVDPLPIVRLQMWGECVLYFPSRSQYDSKLLAPVYLTCFNSLLNWFKLVYWAFEQSERHVLFTLFFALIWEEEIKCTKAKGHLRALYPSFWSPIESYPRSHL